MSFPAAASKGNSSVIKKLLFRRIVVMVAFLALAAV